MRYPVYLTTDDGVNYGAVIPDVPGCYGADEGVDATIENVRTALAASFEYMAEHGEDIPAASTIDAHKDNPDYHSGVWAYVDLDISAYMGKAERVQVTLPGRLLNRIDRLVEHDPRFASRSALLAKGAELILSKTA